MKGFLILLALQWPWRPEPSISERELMDWQRSSRINISRMPSRGELSSCSAGTPTLPETQYQDRSGHHMLVMGAEIKTGGHKEAYQGRNGKNTGQRTEGST